MMVKTMPVVMATLAGIGALSEAKPVNMAQHSKRAQTISTSQRIPTFNAALGSAADTTTINAGVTYWLSGPTTHNIYGNLDNSGSVLFSQTDAPVSLYGGMSSYWNVGAPSLVNRAGASITFNDVSATTAPTYVWNIQTMQNDGTIQWCGNAANGGSTYRLSTNGQSTNNGLIVFEQANQLTGTAMSYTAGGSLINNGAFLMRSSRVDFTQNVGGSGCFIIGTNAVMYMDDTSGSSGGTFGGQSIRFADSTGVLHMDAGVYSLNPAFGATVYGFGNGNAIEFLQTILGTPSYAGDTLTVNFLGLGSVRIRIGTGYNPAGFSTVRKQSFYGNYNAVTYTGAVPSGSASAPGTCFRSVATCSSLQGFNLPSGGTTSSATTTAATSTSTSTSTAATSTAAATTTSAAAVPTTTTASTSASTSAATSASSSASTSASTSAATSPATSAATTTTATTSASTGTSTTTAAAPPPSPPAFEYTSVPRGCFRDDAGFGGSRTFAAAQLSSQTLTNQQCANFCGDRGFRFAGSEYRTECYCSDTAPTVQATNCDQPCGGDSTQTCGGDWALTVYENTNVQAQDDSLPANFTPTGCYLDSVNARTFTAYTFNSDTMTPKLCATTCSAKGHAFSGTEYGRECYCSDYAPVTTTDQCNMGCSGDGGLTCGGSNALSVVRDTSITPSGTGPSCPSLPSGFAVCREGQTVVNGACVSA